MALPVPSSVVTFEEDFSRLHDSLESCLNSLGDRAFARDELHCNGTWDTILCWPATAAGTIVRQPCPARFRGVDETKFSFRECLQDGVWAGASSLKPEGWTNYGDCYKSDSLDVYLLLFNGTSSALLKSIARGTRIMEILGLSISFVTLLVSVFIFQYFRNLRCDRTRMYRNLFVAILIHDAILLTVYVDQLVARSSGQVVAGAVYSAPGSIYATATICEILCVLVEYTKTASFMWMLSEGVYLHNILVIAVFSPKPNYLIFYFIGWGLALIPTIIWTVVNVLNNSNKCWFLYQLSSYYWIMEGPRILVICINACFLLSIVRELICKLKANNSSEACQAWKAVRATMFLLPLLGFSNILSMTGPSLDKPINFAIWSFSALFLSSFQGFFISIFCCFLNGEVRSTVMNHWRRRQLNRLIRSQATIEPFTTPVNVILENLAVLSRT